MDKQQQIDMFNDDFDKPRVFRCIAGAFIGTFNRTAAEDGDPIRRLSTFLPTEAAAATALAAGAWPPPEPDEP